MKYMVKKNLFSSTNRMEMFIYQLLDSSNSSMPDVENGNIMSLWFNIVGYLFDIHWRRKEALPRDALINGRWDIFLTFFLLLLLIMLFFKTATNMHMQPLRWGPTTIFPRSLRTECQATSFKCLLTKLKFKYKDIKIFFSFFWVV